MRIPSILVIASLPLISVTAAQAQTGPMMNGGGMWNDGWMGASLSFDGPLTIPVGKPLRLRYGLYVHSGVPAPKKLEQQWTDFSRLPLADVESKKK